MKELFTTEDVRRLSSSDDKFRKTRDLLASHLSPEFTKKVPEASYALKHYDLVSAYKYLRALLVIIGSKGDRKVWNATELAFDTVDLIMKERGLK